MEQQIKLNEVSVLDLRGEAPYLTFPVLTELGFVRHGFSTRLGGVSRKEFASMNLGFGRGDSQENVRENYRRFCASMGIRPEELVFSDQTHESEVRKATASDCGKGYLVPKDYRGVDGQITNEPGVALLVFTADCVPVFFADRKKHAIGAVHSGWRGTVQKIVSRTVERMREEFDSSPEDLIVVIGPSIGPECFEVGPEVAEQFRLAYPPKETEAILFRSSDEISEAVSTEKYRIDLWAANRYALLEAGVPAQNISCSGLCTMCRPDLFFTHRGSGGKRGSLAGVIEINGDIRSEAPEFRHSGLRYR